MKERSKRMNCGASGFSISTEGEPEHSTKTLVVFWYLGEHQH